MGEGGLWSQEMTQRGVVCWVAARGRRGRKRLCARLSVLTYDVFGKHPASFFCHHLLTLRKVGVGLHRNASPHLQSVCVAVMAVQQTSVRIRAFACSASYPQRI